MENITIGKNAAPAFVFEEGTPSGICKIARKVMRDVELVTGARPSETDSSHRAGGVKIVFGIAGSSRLIETMEKQGKLDTSPIRGKREVYGFFVLVEENCIVIAGSDKRGTIYGLFHISELMGVSPLVDFSQAVPAKRDTVSFSEKDSFISKEPSVTYRGFFINDEWPAFGNWCIKHFGGVNARMYEHVFELLLRLKGNYLWPAMWASCFAMDGPGLESAELADEYGVIMGLSHHEPCLRHGEEYSKVRGKGSVYGDAWDFRSNREGITRFWRDGLKRNGHLENIITVGMRGERDSTILGEEATLKDNIDLLRDVLKTQNRLISEEVSSDLEKVPRMLALYKEVEPYYYGDENTEGLRNDPELDGVILMLCDDNHGYVRSLPDEEMRRHKGGFGMYYHFDYHGSPVSYEWINSTYLPEVWEQLTACYENGVRELWIVNVGDLGLQEMPLSYFMDLAYDYEKYGINAPNTTGDYMDSFMQKQFGGALNDSDIKALAKAYTESTRLIHNRRPEHLDGKVYHPVECGETQRLLARAEELEKLCISIGEKLPEEYKPSYTELISYNMLGGLGLIKLWLMSGLNSFFAEMGAAAANDYGARVLGCLERDEELKNELHTAAGGKWNGFGLAEHIGFKDWNSEECRYPVIRTVLPVKRAELAVGTLYEEGWTCGGPWTGKKLTMERFLDKNTEPSSGFYTALTGSGEVSYKVSTDKEWLSIDSLEGTLSDEKKLIIHKVTVEEEKLFAGRECRTASDTARITVSYSGGRVTIEVPYTAVRADEENAGAYLEENGVIAVNCEHCSCMSQELTLLDSLGRNSSGLRLSPSSDNRELEKDPPFAEFRVYACKEGRFELIFGLLPTNPYTFGRGIRAGFSVNGGAMQTLEVIGSDYVSGECEEWEQGVLDHLRETGAEAELKEGLNTVRFFFLNKEDVLEKFTAVREGARRPGAYLGPEESRIIR